MHDETNVTADVIESLLSHTATVMNHVFWFTHNLHLQPDKPHFGSTINYTDIKCREDDFLKELINTITSWVYSKAQAKTMIDERLRQTNDDFQNAATFLTSQAFSKFRPGYSQGQFGELLLFNFIQHFFNAVPLLRKMRITTSSGHERFGADAIHVKIEGPTTVLILGESKCYQSRYKFKEAFSTSLSSITTTFTSLDRELDLYTYDDFLESELEDIAKKYKRGELRRARFELVCLIAYHETQRIDGANEEEIKESIRSTIEDRCQ